MIDNVDDHLATNSYTSHEVAPHQPVSFCAFFKGDPCDLRRLWGYSVGKRSRGRKSIIDTELIGGTNLESGGLSIDTVVGEKWFFGRCNRLLDKELLVGAQWDSRSSNPDVPFLTC